MSATGYTPILSYGSTTASNVPLAANLTTSASGVELAVNAADGKLFYKDSGGVVQVLASKAGNVNVSSFSAGTTGLTPNTATTGAVTLAGTLATTNGGTGLTSFTANGVVYASSTSALTTGSALTFDGTNLGVGGTASGSKLHVMSAGSVSAKIENTAGTGAAFSQLKNTAGSTFLGQDSTGGYLLTDSASPILFYINNSEQMRLTSTGLGIGTSSPAAKLDVQVAGVGIQLKQSSTGSATYYVMDNTVETGGKRWRFGYTGAAGISTFSLYNATDGVTSLVADSSGNLGLGVTPSAWGAGGNIQGSNGFVWSSYDGSLGAGYYYNGGYKYISSTAPSLYAPFGGQHKWYTAPSGTAGNAITFTQAMTLDSSGNLGVGTTSPSSYGKIASVISTPAAGAATSYFGASDGTKSFQLNQTGSTYSYAGIGSNELWYYGNSNYSALTFGSDGAVPIKFVSNGAERMRIDTSGNLLVGTTSGSFTTRFVSVNTDRAGYFQTTSSTNTQDIVNVAGVGGATSYNALRFWYGALGTGSVVGSIAITSVATIYNTTSDYRLKTVLGAVTGHGERIDALKPIDYQWKDGGQNARGFLAHQFQEVYAGSVTGAKDAVDAEGNPVYQQMQPSTPEVIADLVAEIQSLRKRLAAAGI